MVMKRMKGLPYYRYNHDGNFIFYDVSIDRVKDSVLQKLSINISIK